MSTATIRFDELRRHFRTMVPSRKISRERWRDIARAASLEQIREIATLERALGTNHDKSLLDQMRIDVRAHLKSAGAQFK